ncbi:MAG: nucleotidyltransferase family protein [Planctomycetota bacterium]
MGARIEIPANQLQVFCQRWAIRELALFGSVLRDDFRPDSDVDVLVTFDEGAKRSLLDRVRMVRELEELLGRNVDLVQERLLDNPYRRQEILRTKETVYAAEPS